MSFFPASPERFAGAEFARKVWFMGRGSLTAIGIPTGCCGFFAARRGHGAAPQEHCAVKVEGASATLLGDLLHYSNPNISGYVSKINYFADIHLQRQVAEGAKMVGHGGGFPGGVASLCGRISCAGDSWMDTQDFSLRLRPLTRHWCGIAAFSSTGNRQNRYARQRNFPDHFHLPEARCPGKSASRRRGPNGNARRNSDCGRRIGTADSRRRRAMEREIPLRHMWHEDIGFRKTIILNKALAAARRRICGFSGW